MIRRGFWLTTGAVTGIVAYRRVSAVGRRFSASLNPRTSLDAGTGRRAVTGAGQRQPLISVRRTRRAAVRAARDAHRFTRDVREGMDLYMARQSASASSTLRTNQDAQPQALEAARPDDTKDGH